MDLENLEVFYSPRSQSFCLNTGQKDTTSSAEDANELLIRRPKGLGIRHLMVIIGFWGFSMAYAMRFNLAIAIVVMAKPSENTRSLPSLQFEAVTTPSPHNLVVDLNDLEHETSTPASSDTCIHEAVVPVPEASSSSTAGEFDWDEEEKYIVLSSFFWGYVITQLPGGIIATMYGGKWILGTGLLINGVLTLLIPLAARSNIYMLIYVRFVQGLAQGVIFPAMQTILANWAPPEERSHLSAIVYSGCPFGAAVTMVFSGYITESKEGWPLVFYITGAVTILWAGCWSLLVSNSPSEDRKISKGERDYIVAAIGPQNQSNKRTPWKKIFTSGPVWTIAVAQFGHDWGLYTLLLGLPSYLKSVLLFNMEQDSWLSACPFIFEWIFSNIVTIAADQVILRGWMTCTRTRKVCHGVAEFGPAFAMIGAILVRCNRTAIVSLLTIAVTLSGAACGSYLPNQVEIAPNYAGIVMGITNTVGNMAGFATALTIGAFTKHEPSKTNWMYVFVIAICMLCANAVIYIMFSSSEEQSWNRSSEDELTQSQNSGGADEFCEQNSPDSKCETAYDNSATVQQ